MSAGDRSTDATTPASRRRSGHVVAAFPATGKSFLAAQTLNAEDSDSSLFSWKWTSFETRQRHPEWPDNYMRRIREILSVGGMAFVSTHAEVRSALEDAGILFTLVYPEEGLRDEYRERMERRGSPAALIHTVIDNLWDDALAECREQTGCIHVVLRSGQYLSSVIR